MPNPNFYNHLTTPGVVATSFHLRMSPLARRSSWCDPLSLYYRLFISGIIIILKSHNTADASMNLYMSHSRGVLPFFGASNEIGGLLFTPLLCIHTLAAYSIFCT
jgi:hypothetical protein